MIDWQDKSQTPFGFRGGGIVMGGCMVAAAVLLSQTPFGFGGGLDCPVLFMAFRDLISVSNAFRLWGRVGYIKTKKGITENGS